MIEDGPGSQHGGQLGPGSGGLGMVTKSQQDDGIKQRPQYSMPGILHFLQTEWARFEMERSQWEVERAELQARIAFLQGERKGQENLKQDLVRRIKMLEFALKQERAKYHKLKYGTDLNPEDLKPPSFDKKNEDDQVDGEISISTTSGTSNATWRQGRQLLRQYLQEIGYTDTIIDVRSARVRSLLGLQSQAGDNDSDISQSVLVNGEQQSVKRDVAGKREIARRYREKKRQEGSRQTRTSTCVTLSTPRVNRQSMTPEERRAHDNRKRREAYHARSKQKKIADKKKSAAYMRNFRLRKKMEKSAQGQTTPNATSTPLPGPCANVDAPQELRLEPRVQTPPKRGRMRQHCYNIASKVKRSLKNAFSDDEVAKITCNLVLRKTPEKRKKNVEQLLEHPVLRRALAMSAATRRTRVSTLLHIQKRSSLRKNRYALVAREIKKFYTKPEVSRVLPHKRYATKHGPGYVMLVTLDYAHKAFCQQTGKTVSFSFFASLRPHNVRKVGTVATETCLCICCTNVKLKIDALNRRLKGNILPSEGNLMNYILCPYTGRWPRMGCIDGSCTACSDHIRPFTLATREIFHDGISWLHWERRPKMLENGQTSMKLDVFPFEGTVYDLLTQLHRDLNEPVKGTSFIRHLFNAYWQQSQYNICKDTLQQGQLLMVQDFAKNRTATYNKEVKSAYFGKQQISLHPSVCYYKNKDGQMVRHVIMFFSDDIKHDAHHVHVVTKEAVAIVKTHAPVKEVIIWSDGAGSQYKGRKTFGDLSLYSEQTERHFFGSEHGKGEADAETGRFSQAMKRACSSGFNFRDAKDMVAFAASCYKQDALKMYSFVNIPLEDIRRDRPECDVSTVPGTRSLHQVVAKKKYVLAVRAHSCFCSGCRSGDATCCINKSHVKPLEVVKLNPSVPHDEAFLEDQKEQEVLPAAPIYTRAGLKKISNMANENALIDAENAVMTTFDFLNSGSVVVEEEDLSDENEDGMAADDESEERLERKGIKLKNDTNETMTGLDENDPDTVEALAEFHFLESEMGEGSEKRDSSSGDEEEEWVVDQRHISELKEQYKKERKGKKNRPTRHALQAMLANLGGEDENSSAGDALFSHHSSGDSGDDDGVPAGSQINYARKPMMGLQDDEENLDGGLGLGELAGLTVNNEADPINYDISASKEVYRKTWNAKYTLRSHFDGVRALAFHPVEPVLLTASEDHTLKLWNLQKTVPAKKAASLDVEPVYTFRAHMGPVLSLAVSPSGEQCYSGGMDTRIRCWNIPSSNIDPYDSFDPNVLSDTLVAHTDAVWGLSIHSSKNHLLSCSGDGTVRLWSPGTKSPLLNTFTVESEEGVPTSVDFVRCDPTQMVASYTSSNTYIFDIETGKQVLMLETKLNSDSSGSNQINRVINHPTLPITITAHEDRHIRFFDNNTGKIIHSMVAHLDSVTSLAIDPNGLYLLSGSHDCSIRLWNLESKTCVQEITSHRKKFEESIHDVAFHPQKPYIASAGADALAKVFV